MQQNLFNIYDFIKIFYPFSPRRYKDSNGIDKIGYGHKCEQNDGLELLTEDEAFKLLTEDLELAISSILYLVTAKINANQMNALVALVYDVGNNAFEQSKLRQIVNLGDLTKLPEGFLQFSLVRDTHTSLEMLRKRVAELELFQRPLEA